MNCNLTYVLTAGGRVNGQRCGSCDAGPLFVCALQAWDGLCASKYCSHLALCDDIPPCYSGTYLDQRVIGSESAYMGQHVFGSGGAFLDRKQYSCEPCPAGRFGNASGLVGEGCSGKCAAGHFCPKGSVSEYASRCGGNAYYCPLGSALPLTAPAGRRTVGGDPDGTTRDGTVLCDPGHYCVGGEQKACPAGQYGDRSGLGTAACSGLCRAGHFCPIGTVNPEKCSPGYYCPDGKVQIPCPAGTFGSVFGLRDEKCSGFCSEGHFCPQGSVSGTERMCPAGRFGMNSGLTNDSCSGPCPAGFYCPAGTSSGSHNRQHYETL